jgi:TrmH family RNA methyltransferase
MDNIYIILVEPIYKGNVGSVARIMRNFEFMNLRVVGSVPQKEDYVIGVHADEILESAEVFGSLQEAVKDLDRVIALSRRKGSKKVVDLSPAQLREYIADCNRYMAIGNRPYNLLKIGLVFGRETYGLTDEEADLCDLRCHITANEAFPSLNLAQAVAVVLYEIYSHQSTVNSPQSTDTTTPSELIFKATKPEIEDSLTYATEVLDTLKIFQNEADKKDITDYLHSLMYRANPTKQMTTDLKKLFNRIHLAFYGKGKGF